MGKLRENESFVRLFLGRIVTNMGDSMYGIAAMWLVFELTGSTVYTGIAGFLVRIPASLQFLVGPLVDRWSIRSILVRTQLVQGVCVLFVPLAAITGTLSVWVVLSIIPVLTFLNQFVYPAQNTALPRILDEGQLVRANSLFSFANKGTNMVFDAASGVLISIIGAVALYVVDAVTFGIAVLLFRGVSIPSRSGKESDSDESHDETSRRVDEYWSKLVEGYSYIRGSAVLALALGGIVANFAYGVIIATLPAFADLRGGPEVYGLLTAAMATGSLIGAAVATRIEDRPFGQIMIVSYLLSGVCWLGAVTVSWLPATVALFVLTFIPIGIENVMTNSLYQSAVDDELLGRVTAVTSSLSTVMMPAGLLLGGAAASVFDLVDVLSVTAFAISSISFYVLLRPRLRTLPPVADTDGSNLGLD